MSTPDPQPSPTAAERDEPRPLVSVIMIFFNAERFIEEAVESVLAQTYEHRELLLVDDGSTDRSPSLARDYAARFPDQIRYLAHEGRANLGMSASRNLGLERSRGAYVAFLDADDVYLPEKLAHQVGILETNPRASMVYGPTMHWYSWTGRPEDARDQPRRLGVEPGRIMEPPELIPKFLRLEAQTPGTCGVLVRRDAALACGGFEATFRGMFEDQIFLFKLCLQTPVYVDGRSLDLYRQHPESHSRLKRATRFYRGTLAPSKSYGAFLRWVEEYVRRQGIHDPDVDEALRNELRPYRNPLRYGLGLGGYYLGRAARFLRRT